MAAPETGDRDDAHVPTRFPWTAMLALAAAAFLAVTSETLPTGLLPEIGAGLRVTTPEAGLLVSVYAFTVVLAATPLTALTMRVPRRLLVVAVIIVIGLSSILLAMAPNYGVAIVARVLGGMAHGVFWAVTGSYVGHVARSHQLARAVAITSGGVSLALILGAPLATILGHAMGWRVAFAVVGGLLVVGAIAVGIVLPSVSRVPRTARRQVARHERIRDASIRPVIVICLLIGVITLGNFTLNAYVAPFVADAMGLGTAAVAPMLFVGGMMGAVAVMLVGTVLGRRPNRSIAACLVITALSVAVLGAFAGVPPAAIAAFAIWALAFGGLPPLVQTQMLHAASSAFRDTASALYTTAFNVGIGGGALVGGAIYAVWGIGAVPWAALAILIISVAMLVIARRWMVRPLRQASAPRVEQAKEQETEGMTGIEPA